MSLERLRTTLASNPHHFAPYFLLGDPDPETSLELCRAAVTSGATILELGIPYSDPVADGPTLQAASHRALTHGGSLGPVLEVLGTLSSECTTPLSVLVYANLLHRRGSNDFLRELKHRGVSTILVPDVPWEESRSLREATASMELGYVDLCGPRSERARIAAMGEASNAYLYLAGGQTTTGARTELDPGLGKSLRRVRAEVSIPICVGFGLRTPQHLDVVFREGAQIAVVGSALSNLIGSHLDDAGIPVDRKALIGAVAHRCLELSKRAKAHRSESQRKEALR